MKKYFLKFSIVCCSSILLFSCQKNVNITVDAKYTKQLLVLNSVLQPDSNATIQVSKSVSAIGTDAPSVVTDATVDLWENGKFLMNCSHIGNGIYSANYKPLANHEYTFKAHETGMTDVDGSSSIPTNTPITITSIDSVNEDIVLQLNDPSDANYYTFELTAIDTTGYSTSILLYTDNSMLLDNSKSPVFSFGRHGNKKLHRIPNYISDQLFNGQSNSFVLSFNTNNNSHGGHGGPPPPISNNTLPSGTYVLKVTNVSSQIYKYFKTVDGALNPNPFAEPTQIFSNINNGLGVIGSRNSQIFTLLKK
ncbi:MAG: hypothetical protein RJA07_2059 [Bacteroidota bacterium]|jgi:hypothetical protein